MKNLFTAGGALAAGLVALLAGGAASAQSITVLPVNLYMPAGKQTASLKVINQGSGPTSVQVRVVAWNQADGAETIVPTDAVMVSPPIATIPGGGAQVVRLVLRKPVVGHEATYRIILDQIPAPADPGTVRIALRLSIPVFAQPATRALPRVAYHVENNSGQTWLVGVNDGNRHETTRNLVLTSSDGGAMKLGNNASPYILSGATQRWPVTTTGGALASGAVLRLTGQGDTGAINSAVPFAGTP